MIFRFETASLKKNNLFFRFSKNKLVLLVNRIEFFYGKKEKVNVETSNIAHGYLFNELPNHYFQCVKFEEN